MGTMTEHVTPSQPLLMRILVRPFAYRHRKAWGAAEMVAGAWVLIMGGILCSYGFWWGAALIAVSALQLWIGHQLLTSPQR